MISEVEYDDKTKKVVIRFDEDNRININDDQTIEANIKLYCKSDSLFEMCTLKHQPEDVPVVTKKCAFSSPPLCKDGVVSKDNMIKYSHVFSNNFSFTLQEISPKGKYIWKNVENYNALLLKYFSVDNISSIHLYIASK